MIFLPLLSDVGVWKKKLEPDKMDGMALKCVCDHFFNFQLNYTRPLVASQVLVSVIAIIITTTKRITDGEPSALGDSTGPG